MRHVLGVQLYQYHTSKHHHHHHFSVRTGSSCVDVSGPAMTYVLITVVECAYGNHVEVKKPASKDDVG